MKAGEIVDEVLDFTLTKSSQPHSFLRRSVTEAREYGEILCEISQIDIRYKGRSGAMIDAVRKASLQIHVGEKVGIVGATGCGKSSIARALTGLVTPAAGMMQFQGLPLDYRKHPELRSSIQMIFQDPYSALYPHLTIGGYLREAMRRHHIATRREEVTKINEMLDRVGLSEQFAHRYPKQLSGGERQRVQIARSFLMKPRLLICDEITSGLDADIQSQILQLLHELYKDSNLSILLISHDLNVVREVADTLVVMDAGEIVETGAVENVFSQPGHAVTRRLISTYMAGSQ